MKNTFCVSVVMNLFLLTISSLTVKAQSLSSKPSVKVERISPNEVIHIDGYLNEAEWEKSRIISGFTQNRPIDGGNPSQKTEVRILYSDKNLYVGIYAYDSSPDSISTPLFRRDGDELSDWVFVNVDSYNDNRTAFTFGVNPVGVQKDIMYFNDVEEDVLWDAVWESKTSIVSDGWIAEIRIPLSQLRFTSSKNEQKWGINFERHIARNYEVNYWAPVPREEYGVVSWYGDLLGISNLSKPLRLEVLPYISGELTREPNLNVDNPFYKKNNTLFKAGGDIKYGISSGFTLTSTINPDFGQVEADPATINLSVFEEFFEERRPFFLEGSDIFSFGATTSQNTFSTHSNFYSRRIGREPVGSTTLAGLSSNFEDRPTESTIAGAVKLSGKTDKGLSIGFLNAYTLEESAEYVSTSNNSVNSFELEIEPATNYMATRVKHDLRDGDAQIGAYLSSVNRSLNGSYLQNYVHESAYQIGVDGQYYWNERNWGASGVLSLSQVNGKENALLRTQQSSARYYDRVDSDYLTIDSSKTSLEGYFGEFSIGKYSGAGLRYSFTYSEMSPGYEVNDIGFQERSDYRSPHLYAEYLNVNSDMFRFYLLWAYSGYAWNFDGDMIMNFYASGAYFQLNNLWTILGTGGFTGSFYDDRSSRGGAILKRPKDWNSNIEITSNTTKDFYASLGGAYRNDTSGEFSTRLYSSVNYRPTGYIQLSVAPTIIFEKSTNEKPEFFDDFDSIENGALFASANLDIFYTEFRLNLTFSPKLSLQTYARPLIYSADFYDFKFFKDSKSYNFTPLIEFIEEDKEATVQSFNNAFDFDYRTVQGNAVLRYEYRPGSTFFLVWQQERENLLPGMSRFKPFENSINIFTDDKPTNIFLLKFSYWFGT